MTDPLEQAVYAALCAAGIPFYYEGTGSAGKTRRLDFYLPNYDVYVEVKQFHSKRIAEQMGRADNVIALQGRAAVDLFCMMLRRDVVI